MRTLVPLVVSLALLSSACGSTDDADSATTSPTPSVPETSMPSPSPPAGEGVSLAVSEVARAEPLAPTDPVTLDVVAGDTDLGLDLLRLVADKADNVILSPYSAASALGMLLAGSRDVTESEIAAVLGTVDAGGYHPGRNAVDAAVNEPGIAPPDGDAELFTLRGVNSLFSQEGFQLLEDYLDILARFYGAGVRLVDFVGAPETARVTINDWVAEQTEDRIVDLIPEGVITVDTRVVLVNAIFFKANWQTQFDPGDTAPGVFRAPTGDVTADLMHGSVRTGYVRGDGFEAVRLPYMGNTTSMLLVVPDDIYAFLDTVDAEVVSTIRSELSEHQVELSMPKFEFRTELALKPLLQELGMVEAFTPPSPGTGADLTAMHPERVLFVQDAIQQAFVSVDEEGTEAAAATAVVIGLESAPPPARLDVDRPFVFIIENDATGEPLFLAAVFDPTQS